jgi:hypothetical protein
VEFFKYLNTMITNEGRCTCEIKSRIAVAKAAFYKKRAPFTSTMDIRSRKKLVKCYILNIALYGAETRMLWAVDQKHLESLEMWCWRSMEKISWTDHVKNGEVLLSVKDQRLELTTHPHLAQRLKERLALYLYSPSGPSWLVLV